MLPALACNEKTSCWPATAMIPLMVADAVFPDTTGTTGVAVGMLWPLPEGTNPSFEVMMATSSWSWLAPVYSPLLHCVSGL
jgi:hypothetical protein